MRIRRISAGPTRQTESRRERVVGGTELTSRTWIVVALASSLLLGALLPLVPLLAAAPLAVLAGAALVVSPLVRVVVVVFGGLFVFQASQALDLPKIAYLAAVAVAFAAALPQALQELRGSPRPVRGLLVGAGCVGIVSLMSLPVSLLRGDDALTWVRGVAPYGLFVVVPVFALDAAYSIPRRWLMALLVIAGTLSTASYAVEWFARRDLTALAFNRLVLPSTLLPAALFAMAIAIALGTGRLRPLWAGLAGWILLIMLLTGSRTNLVLLAALPSVFVAAGGGISLRTVRLFGIIATLLILTGAGLVFITGAGGFAGDRLADRLASVTTVLADPGSDPSYYERAAQTAAAFEDWARAPLFGTGPAHEVIWRKADGSSEATLVIDSPLLYPMRFGLIGIAALAAVLLGWLKFIRATPDAVARGTLAGTWGVAIAFAILVSPLDDKGFAMALLLAMAIALAPKSLGAEEPRRRPERGRVRSDSVQSPSLSQRLPA